MQPTRIISGSEASRLGLAEMSRREALLQPYAAPAAVTLVTGLPAAAAQPAAAPEPDVVTGGTSVPIAA